MGAPRRQQRRPPSRPSSARPRCGGAPDDGPSSTSKQLSDALTALLQPLRLAGGLELRAADAPRAVHCCRRGDGSFRQEICFLRIEEAPPPPPKQRVRIGGGYHVTGGGCHATELRRTVAAAAAANAAARASSPRAGAAAAQRPGQAWASSPRRPAASEEASGEAAEASYLSDPGDRFVHGSVSAGASAEVYKFGAYTLGEDRGQVGDRRQNPAIWASYDNTATGDAAFRVLSSERRKLWRTASAEGARSASRQPGHAATAPAAATPSTPGAVPVDFSSLEPGPAAEALGALLGALGVKEGAANGGGVGLQGPQVHRSEAAVGGRWSVELCYVCADRSTERVVERVVERSIQQDDACAQTEPWCSECRRFGHLAESCPYRPRTTECAAQTELWCTHCGSAGHLAADCRNCICCVCGDIGHVAKECPHQHLPPPPETGDSSMQTELWCAGCGEVGHMLPDCPLVADARRSRDRRDAGTQPSSLSYGAGMDSRTGRAGSQDTRQPSEFAASREATRPLDVRLATESRAGRRSRSTNRPPSARYRVGGGYEIVGQEVPGLADGGLDAAAAQQALSGARVAGHLDEISGIVYDACGQPLSDDNAGTRRRRPGSAPPAGRAKVVARGQGFDSFAELEQDRCVRASGHLPDGANGYLVGTFVPGFYDRHRFGSDRGARMPFKVYRSRITRDAACPRPDPYRARPPMPSRALAEDGAGVAEEADAAGEAEPAAPGGAADEEERRRRLTVDAVAAQLEGLGLEAIRTRDSKHSGGATPSTTAADMSVITARSSERTDPSVLEVHPQLGAPARSGLPIPARPASWSSPAQAGGGVSEYLSPGSQPPEPEQERPLPQAGLAASSYADAG